nr:PREDICTED: GON-4-like protein isoform X1 [Latimeria chalumnae]|eukprot:XP_006001694.1 PREDICTED: GON-4-like protein isoform X1 [Latimeria chalumnae]
MEELFDTFQDELGVPEREEEGVQEDALLPSFNIPQSLTFEEPLANMLNEQHRTVREQLEMLKHKRVGGKLQEASEASGSREKRQPETLLLDKAQKLQLQQQMQQHVQLLTQVNLLTRVNPSLRNEAETSKLFLWELASFAESSTIANSQGNTKFKSAFLTCNLMEALQLTQEFETMKADVRVSPKKNPPQSKKITNELLYLPKQLAWIFATRSVFMYTELLPICSLRQRNPKDKISFTKGEDNLMALGLKHFEDTDFPKPLISKYLMPSKTPHQLTVRIKNLNPRRAPENVIKVYKREKELPPMHKLCEVVPPEQAKPPVEREVYKLPFWLQKSLPFIQHWLQNVQESPENRNMEANDVRCPGEGPSQEPAVTKQDLQEGEENQAGNSCAGQKYPLALPLGVVLKLKPTAPTSSKKIWRQRRSPSLKPLFVKPPSAVQSTASKANLQKQSPKMSKGPTGQRQQEPCAPRLIKPLMIQPSPEPEPPKITPVAADNVPSTLLANPENSSNISAVPEAAMPPTCTVVLKTQLLQPVSIKKAPVAKITCSRKPLSKKKSSVNRKKTVKLPSSVRHTPVIFAVPAGMKVISIGNRCSVLRPVVAAVNEAGHPVPLRTLLVNPAPFPCTTGQSLVTAPIGPVVVSGNVVSLSTSAQVSTENSKARDLAGPPSSTASTEAKLTTEEFDGPIAPLPDTPMGLSADAVLVPPDDALGENPIVISIEHSANALMGPFEHESMETSTNALIEPSADVPVESSTSISKESPTWQSQMSSVLCYEGNTVYSPIQDEHCNSDDLDLQDETSKSDFSCKGVAKKNEMERQPKTCLQEPKTCLPVALVGKEVAQKSTAEQLENEVKDKDKLGIESLLEDATFSTELNENIILGLGQELEVEAPPHDINLKVPEKDIAVENEQVDRIGLPESEQLKALTSTKEMDKEPSKGPPSPTEVDAETVGKSEDSPINDGQSSGTPGGPEACGEKDGQDEEEEEDFDDLTQDEEDEEVMSTASEESILSVPELQETMEKLTWLASERRLSQEGDSEEENSQEENSEPEEEEEGADSLQKEEETTDEAVEERAEKTTSRSASPQAMPESEVSSSRRGESAKAAGKGRGSHRSRSKKGRSRPSKDTSKLLLLYDEDILENDPLREQKDLAFAQAYLNRVRDALRDTPGKYEEFLRALYNFELNLSQRTAVDLYSELHDMLQDWPHLLKDFAAFLLPEQALECGLFEEQQAFDKSRKLLRQLEICFGDNPSHYQKIIKALQSSYESQPHEIAELKVQMWQLLKGHHNLQDEFSVFFDHLPPPASRLVDFEEVIWTEDKEYEFDGFEEVVLMDLEEEEETQKLQAASKSKRRKEIGGHSNEKDLDWPDGVRECICCCHDASGMDHKLKKSKKKSCSHCSGNKTCDTKSYKGKDIHETVSGSPQDDWSPQPEMREAGIGEEFEPQHSRENPDSAELANRAKSECETEEASSLIQKAGLLRDTVEGTECKKGPQDLSKESSPSPSGFDQDILKLSAESLPEEAGSTVEFQPDGPVPVQWEGGTQAPSGTIVTPGQAQWEGRSPSLQEVGNDTMETKRIQPADAPKEMGLGTRGRHRAERRETVPKPKLTLNTGSPLKEDFLDVSCCDKNWKGDQSKTEQDSEVDISEANVSARVSEQVLVGETSESSACPLEGHTWFSASLFKERTADCIAKIPDTSQLPPWKPLEKPTDRTTQKPKQNPAKGLLDKGTDQELDPVALSGSSIDPQQRPHKGSGEESPNSVSSETESQSPLKERWEIGSDSHAEGSVSHSQLRARGTNSQEESHVLDAVEQKGSEMIVCAKNIKVSSTGEKVVLWTREADRIILTACQERGANQETFTTVAEELGNKTAVEVSRRFRELVQLFHTACDGSSEEEEDAISTSNMEQLSDREQQATDEEQE